MTKRDRRKPVVVRSGLSTGDQIVLWTALAFFLAVVSVSQCGGS